MAVAGDFDWMKQMNVVAQADPTGFKAQFATRFNIGSAKVSAIVGNFPNPADAYMVMRLGEMSHHPARVCDGKIQVRQKERLGGFREEPRD